MSWGVIVRGNSTDIGVAFERERAEKERLGAPVGELENIDSVSEFAMEIADLADERLQVSANGNWIQRLPETENQKPVWHLGELSVRITRA